MFSRCFVTKEHEKNMDWNQYLSTREVVNKATSLLGPWKALFTAAMHSPASAATDNLQTLINSSTILAP